MSAAKPTGPELEPLRKWIHELNNRVGVILASAELLQLEQLSPKAMERVRHMEAGALELRDLLRTVADYYLHQ